MPLPWNKQAILLGGFCLLIGLFMALWSGRMNARALGANLLRGQIELAHEDNSPEQLKRNAARVCADRVFWVGIALTAIGVMLQTWGGLL